MCTKKLVFTKGDETRPKIEDLNDLNQQNESIFSDIYSRAFKLIDEIAKQPDNGNDERIRERNNIIAFIGERGSGKTSCLRSIYQALPKHEKSIMASKQNTIIYNNDLPIIDPSYFDDHSNILEIVIAHMFKTFKKNVNNNSHDLREDKLENKRHLVKCFQAVKDALDSLNRTKKEDKYHNDSIEELSKMAAGSNLHEEMEELVKSYLNYFHEGTRDCKKILVIAIDDLDVQTNHTYKMVEQIRKYLIIDNVIILIGVKLVQLSDLIKKKYSEDFSNKEDGNDKIDDMVARYLMKLLPLSHRLNLPSYNEIPDVKLIIADQSKTTPNDESQSKTESASAIPEGANIQETILGLIYSKTDFMFYNSLEQESLIIPNNLRELLNLVALLYNMSDKPEDKNNNRKVFRQYFIESWCLDRLTSKQHSFIKEMNECDAICINKFIIDYISREYYIYINSNSDPYLDAIINPLNKSYNISIADIYYILGQMSNSLETGIKRFVFAIKTVYSIILHDKFLEMNDPSHTDKHADSLFNILTNKAISYKSSNKINHIFDYEKMLGVNIISLGENSILAGTVSEHEIRKLYNEVKIGLSRYGRISARADSNYSEYIYKLNTLEFFLLSTTYYGKVEKARLYKHSPYNSFPVNEFNNSDGIIAFNFTAIVYNVIRYYNLLRKLVIMKDKLDITTTLEEFFSIIMRVENNSIIYNIFSQLGLITIEDENTDDNTSKKINRIKQLAAPKNKNIITYYGQEYIDSSAILNLEMLEMMEGYLGYIDRGHSEDDSKNLDYIIEFFDKLSSFKYYRYEPNDNKLAYKEIHLNLFNKITKYLKEVKRSNDVYKDSLRLSLSNSDKPLFFQLYNSSRNS